MEERNYLEEMDKFICSNYQQAVSTIAIQKENARKHSKKLTTEPQKQGEAVHREIEIACR